MCSLSVSVCCTLCVFNKYIASGNNDRNRTVFSSRRKTRREGAFRTCCDVRAAATENNRSPRVCLLANWRSSLASDVLHGPWAYLSGLRKYSNRFQGDQYMNISPIGSKKRFFMDAAATLCLKKRPTFNLL